MRKIVGALLLGGALVVFFSHRHYSLQIEGAMRAVQMYYNVPLLWVEIGGVIVLCSATLIGAYLLATEASQEKQPVGVASNSWWFGIFLLGTFAFFSYRLVNEEDLGVSITRTVEAVIGFHDLVVAVLVFIVVCAWFVGGMYLTFVRPIKYRWRE